MNNMKQCAYIIIVGFLTYGFGSLIILALNGVLIGIVLEMIVQNKISYAIFTGFLPHGIFEIPAILIVLISIFHLEILRFPIQEKKDGYIYSERSINHTCHYLFFISNCRYNRVYNKRKFLI